MMKTHNISLVLKVSLLVISTLCIYQYFLGYKRPNILQEIHSIQEALLFIDKVDAHTLVAFDINDVLLQYNDLILQPINKERKIAYLNKIASKHGYQNRKRDDIKAIILQQATRAFPEKDTKTVLQAFCHTSPYVIAVTSCRTHSCGRIDSMPDWRIQELAHFGIRFSTPFPSDMQIQIHQSLGNHALFKAGCLFCGNIVKGVAVQAFLDHIYSTTSWRPSALVCIDDKMSNLLSLQKTAKNLKIPFYGLYYTYGLSQKDANPQISTYQIEHLFSDKTWIPDSKVLAIIDKTPQGHTGQTQ